MQPNTVNYYIFSLPIICQHYKTISSPFYSILHEKTVSKFKTSTTLYKNDMRTETAQKMLCIQIHVGTKVSHKNANYRLTLQHRVQVPTSIQEEKRSEAMYN